jgi:CHAD domain-containing protein
MATEHVEIERKFDVATSFALPDLTGVAGVGSVAAPAERRLEAVYFDTPDLRLARARITLRRRTGGPDGGWHLKLPAAGGARRELHAPLGPDTGIPPRVLTRPLTGILRGAPPAPVAELRTHRVVTILQDGGGRVLAEVADDRVTATVPAPGPGEAASVRSWREVEVELVDGEDAVLAKVEDVLVAAGARPSESASKLARALEGPLATGTAPGAGAGSPGKDGARAGDVVLTAVRAQVSALQDADLMLRTDQPDAVHKLRVAGRRLRSIFAAFRSVLDRAATEPLRRELKWLGLQLSEVRDDEVALARLADLVTAQPRELVLGPVAARLRQARIQEATAGTARALDTLTDPRYLRLLDDLHGLLADPPVTATASRGPRSVLRKAVRRAGRRLRRRVDAAKSMDHRQPTALHDVRKAAKRLRYTGEVARPELGRRMKALVGTVEDVQEVLGDRQDTFLTREHCRRLGIAASAAGENAWTYGRLHGLEEAQAERDEREFWTRWPALRAHLAAATR